MENTFLQPTQSILNKPWIWITIVVTVVIIIVFIVSRYNSNTTSKTANASVLGASKSSEPSPTPTVSLESSPTPTVSLEPSPTPTVSLEPSPTPTVSLEPSPTPTVTLTPSPTPTVTLTPSPTPTTTLPTKITLPPRTTTTTPATTTPEPYPWCRGTKSIDCWGGVSPDEINYKKVKIYMKGNWRVCPSEFLGLQRTNATCVFPGRITGTDNECRWDGTGCGTACGYSNCPNCAINIENYFSGDQLDDQFFKCSEQYIFMTFDLEADLYRKENVPIVAADKTNCVTPNKIVNNKCYDMNGKEIIVSKTVNIPTPTIMGMFPRQVYKGISAPIFDFDDALDDVANAFYRQMAWEYANWIFYPVPPWAPLDKNQDYMIIHSKTGKLLQVLPASAMDPSSSDYYSNNKQDVFLSGGKGNTLFMSMSGSGFYDDTSTYPGETHLTCDPRNVFRLYRQDKGCHYIQNKLTQFFITASEDSNMFELSPFQKNNPRQEFYFCCPHNATEIMNIASDPNPLQMNKCGFVGAYTQGGVPCQYK